MTCPRPLRELVEEREDNLIPGVYSQMLPLTGERERKLKLHEGNVLLFGVRGVELNDGDAGHRQGWEVAHFV